eukprot:3673985-Pleurochrysis_carterae.AAC.4
MAGRSVVMAFNVQPFAHRTNRKRNMPNLCTFVLIQLTHSKRLCPLIQSSTGRRRCDRCAGRSPCDACWRTHCQLVATFSADTSVLAPPRVLTDY